MNSGLLVLTLHGRISASRPFEKTYLFFFQRFEDHKELPANSQLQRCESHRTHLKKFKYFFTDFQLPAISDQVASGTNLNPLRPLFFN